MLTPIVTIVISLLLVIAFVYSAFSIYTIYLFLNSRPTKELRKKVQAKGGIMIIIHSGCIYASLGILGKLNYSPTVDYVTTTLFPVLIEIELIEAISSTMFTVAALIFPFATAAVGTNLITQALCQRTGEEDYDKEIKRQPKRFRNSIYSKFRKYKRWSKED
ncbi:hypothetical protein ISX50_10275 [Vibrio cyclitrophicus]|nr:hypothetical protein [Vibrio cyclitrophicus]UPR33490.1 hypothetical protein ISX50_10275 [Vibrio cyclitrophicus]